MNSRFEKLIVGAVAIGALSLAGCSSNGGDGKKDDSPNDTPGEDPVESTVAFLGGRVLDLNHVALFFAEPVRLPEDTSALAALFTLHGTTWDYGFVPAGTVSYVCTNIGEGCSGGFSSAITAVSIYSSFLDGADAGAITAVDVSAEDSTSVILTIGEATEADEDGTGVLRLAYTGGEEGLTDEEGDYLAAVAVPEGVPGNISVAGPALVYSHVISATEVELVFSEPVQLGGTDPSAAHTYFRLSEPCIPVFNIEYYPEYSGSPVPGVLYLFPSSESSGYIASLSSHSYSFTELTIPAESPNKMILTTPESIGADVGIDGYLRLTYSDSEAGSIQNRNGDSLAPISFEPNQHGNTVNDLGDGTERCMVPVS